MPIKNNMSLIQIVIEFCKLVEQITPIGDIITCSHEFDSENDFIVIMENKKRKRKVRFYEDNGLTVTFDNYRIQHFGLYSKMEAYQAARDIVNFLIAEK